MMREVKNQEAIGTKRRSLPHSGWLQLPYSPVWPFSRETGTFPLYTVYGEG